MFEMYRTFEAMVTYLVSLRYVECAPAGV